MPDEVTKVQPRTTEASGYVSLRHSMDRLWCDIDHGSWASHELQIRLDPDGVFLSMREFTQCDRGQRTIPYREFWATLADVFFKELP